MKRFLYRTRFAWLVVLLVFIFPVSALALTVSLVPVDNSFEGLFAQYLALAGVGSFVAMIVSALKTVTIVTKGKVVLVPDDHADSVSALINVIFFAIFAYLKLLKPDIDIPNINFAMQLWADKALAVIGLLVMLGSSTLAYKYILRGKFLVGTSYSAAAGQPAGTPAGKSFTNSKPS